MVHNFPHPLIVIINGRFLWRTEGGIRTHENVQKQQLFPWINQCVMQLSMHARVSSWIIDELCKFIHIFDKTRHLIGVAISAEFPSFLWWIILLLIAFMLRMRMSTCPMEFFFMWDNLTMPFTCSIYGFTVHRYAVNHLNYHSTSALTRNFYLIKVIKEAIFPFSELILKFNLPPRICNHHPVACHSALYTTVSAASERRIPTAYTTQSSQSTHQCPRAVCLYDVHLRTAFSCMHGLEHSCA